MKTSLYLITLLTLLGSFTAQAQSRPAAWVDKKEKIVVIATNPTLNVSVVKIAVDETYYARLDFSLNYVSSDMSHQIQSIMKDYAGYLVQRVVIERNGPYHLRIPVLSISNDVEPKPGVEGPYLEDSIYLNRAQYKAVQTELRTGRPLVRIEGNLLGTVPMTIAVEHKEVGSAVCSRLLGQDQTVASTIANFLPAATQILADIDFKYPQTKAALLEELKNNCFGMAYPSQPIASFSDLLKVPLEAKTLGKILIGEMFQKIYTRQDIELTYENIQNGGQ